MDAATLTYDTLRFAEFEEFPQTEEPVWILGRESSALTATLTYDTLRFAEFEEFPQTEEPVWILGRESSALTEKDDILCDISSRLWFTYRKNFPPIGGTGPTSDTGWGCMLRCGQMILGEALVFRHLGRDWRWVKGKRQREEYYSILNAFIDKKDSYYSIHQIEKDDILCDISSRLWFTYRKNFPPIGGTGPTSDTGWGCMLRCGQMILGEALVFRHLGRDWRWVKGKRQREEYYSILNAFIDKKDSYYSIHQIAQMGVGEGKSIGQWYGPNTVAQVLKKLSVFDSWSRLAVHVAMDNTVVIEEISECRFYIGGEQAVKLSVFDSWSRLAVHVAMDNTVVIEEIKRLCMPWLDYAGAAAFLDPDLERELNGFTEGACALDQSAVWKPLVLLIPLRLGLSEINEAYIETLKKCFMLPQSLGVIGGKPNSAHYFIGYVGEELIYLDPHTTQPSVEPCDDGLVPDDSYHCEHPPCRMHIRELDPSIAVGFFCSTEDDFDDWCLRIRKMSGRREALPMFELVDRQPSHFMSSDLLNLTPDFSDSDHLERFFDSEDEEFEILSL
ncbi:UNVERIFIED_CONTAM: hypothetical protein FKN15_027171 [Acipenser sinensis]